MQAEKPNFYAIIPAIVRYDNRLPIGARLLYGEITALSNKDGHCWASNKYFVDVYQIDKATVKRWLTALDDAGYISRSVEYAANGKTIIKRSIKPLVDLVPAVESVGDPRRTDAPTPRGTDAPTPRRKNAPENSTSINNLVKQAVEYLNSKTGKHFNPKAAGTAKPIRARSREGYELDDFKRVIDVKTEGWLNDPKMSKYLRPATLFGSKFDTYLNEQPLKSPKPEPKKPDRAESIRFAVDSYRSDYGSDSEALKAMKRDRVPFTDDEIKAALTALHERVGGATNAVS